LPKLELHHLPVDEIDLYSETPKARKGLMRPQFFLYDSCLGSAVRLVRKCPRFSVFHPRSISPDGDVPCVVNCL